MIEVEGYKIYFKHVKLSVPMWFEGDHLATHLTECVVEKVTPPTDMPKTISALGRAWCSWDDNFSRAKGRKISLAKAIEKFPVEFRTNVWKAYFKKLDLDFVRSKYGNAEAKRLEQHMKLEEKDERLGRDNVA